MPQRTMSRIRVLETSRKSICAALAVAFVGLPLQSAPAAAEEMAGNWAEIDRAQDPCGKWNPLRSGYYDHSTDKGWGYAKMAGKHGVYNTRVWRDTIKDTCGEQDQPGSTTWIYRTNFVRQVWKDGRWVTVDEVILRTVIQRAMFDGLRKGAITAYCEGIQGWCPAWLNDYDGDTTYSALSMPAAEEGDSVATSRVSTSKAGPMTPRPEHDKTGLPEHALAHAEPGTRAGQVLTFLDADLKQLTRAFEVEIIDARQAGSNTLEIVYRYPGYDGLIGLRRDVSEQVIDVVPGDPHYALARNENSPRELATMLRIELEEPPNPASLTPDASGIRWWGSAESE